MKSANHKPFLVAFGVAAAVSLIIYAVLILPNTSKASDALKKIKASEETLRGFGMGQGIDFEDALKKYTDRKTSLSELKDKTLTTLSFKLDSDYILTPDTTPEVQFPIIKNRIVADIRDAYPGFPFDASLGFPDLPKVDRNQYSAMFEKLGACKRLLEIFGETGIDSVVKFRHGDDTVVRYEQARLTLTRRKVFVTIEGRMDAIFQALKAMGTPGAYLRLENMTLSASSSGYSMESDLEVSMLIFAFDAADLYPTPDVTDAPPPITPAPPVSSTPGPVKTPETTPGPETSRTPSNPVGW